MVMIIYNDNSYHPPHNQNNIEDQSNLDDLTLNSFHVISDSFSLVKTIVLNVTAI